MGGNGESGRTIRLISGNLGLQQLEVGFWFFGWRLSLATAVRTLNPSH